MTAAGAVAQRPGRRLPLAPLWAYWTAIGPGKLVLWCYLLWYLVTVVCYFDPSPALWLNALGLSAVVGCALLLSVGGGPVARRDRWQTLRLFLMPFGVSSFSQLIKDQGYWLILPPRPAQQLASVGACALLVAAVALLKWRRAVADLTRSEPR